MNISFKLSYPVDTVAWDGSTIRKRSAKEIRSTLDLLCECGISEVMISGYHLDEDSDFDIDKETKRIGAELASRGMKAAQHHGLSPTYAPLGTSQEEALDHLRRSVDFTANLGSDTLVLHSGRAVGRFAGTSPYIKIFQSQCKRHGRKRLLEQCAENLHTAGKYAKRQGVKIAMENLDSFEPFGSMEDLPELVRLADSSNIGFCLDSGHAHCGGNSILKWMDEMGDKLFTTHFHDNHGPNKKILNVKGFVDPKVVDEHLPPGFGTINWVEIIAELAHRGYSHTVNFESGPWPVLDRKEGFGHAIQYWRVSERLAMKKLNGEHVK